MKHGNTMKYIAGVHVFSPIYNVAVLGNIVTASECRNKGYAKQLIAHTCQSLLKTVSHIGLNVKADNVAAIACYKKLGFEEVAAYEEYLVERKYSPNS